MNLETHFACLGFAELLYFPCGLHEEPLITKLSGKYGQKIEMSRNKMLFYFQICTTEMVDVRLFFFQL